MNKIFHIMCVITIVFVSSACTCGSYNLDDSLIQKESKQIKNTSQQKFLVIVDSIGKEYEQPATRITLKQVSDVSRGVLVGVVADGIGGVVGSGFASVLTSFVASTVYNAYLNSIEAKMSRAATVPMHGIEEEQDALYRIVHDSLNFVFCDNKPKTIEDSIGYLHNQMLSDVKALNHNYVNENSFDYDKLLEDGIGSALKLGYVYEGMDALNKEDFCSFCETVIDVLSKLRNNQIANDKAFRKVKSSLESYLTPEKAQFISTLSKSVFCCLSQNIDNNTLLSYSNRLKNALKESCLTEDDILLCKKLFQTMVSSYIYWKGINEVK